MIDAASRTRALAAALACLGAAALAGCEKPAEPEPAAEATPAPQAAPADPGAAEADPADDAAARVEEIRQGAEGEVQQPPMQPGQTAGDAAQPGSTIASLPGFTPSASAASEAARRHTPALPVTAATPDNAPVFIKVTLIDITDGDDASLAPLAAFLAGDEASAMDNEEVEGLFELIGHLRDQGVAKMLSDGGILVLGGQTAALRVENALPSSIPGVDSVRDTLSVQLSPSLTAPTGEGPDAERLVRLGFDLRMAREDSPWKIVANDLGLDIGPRARAAGTAVVRSGDTFFVVRRITSDSGDREVLALIRPQVMPQEFNK